MSSKILLVTKKKELGVNFKKRLIDERYRVDFADSIETVRTVLKDKRFCLYIIDTDMPDGEGFEICKFVRGISRNPIMCIGECGDDFIIMRCLRYGADSFVKLPFVMPVMIERVKALLRRSVNEENNSTYIYITGNFVFDIDCREVFYKNKKLKLTKGEFNLLSVMVKSGRRVVERETLMKVAGRDGMALYEDNTLSVRMSRLREKLRKIDGEKYFTTVRGVGYRWEKTVKKELKKC